MNCSLLYHEKVKSQGKNGEIWEGSAVMAFMGTPQPHLHPHRINPSGRALGNALIEQEIYYTMKKSKVKGKMAVFWGFSLTDIMPSPEDCRRPQWKTLTLVFPICSCGQVSQHIRFSVGCGFEHPGFATNGNPEFLGSNRCDAHIWSFSGRRVRTGCLFAFHVTIIT